MNALRQFSARHNARRHLALYRRTKNGLLVWRAYQEFRRFSLPVPEEILQLLDAIAGRLADAHGQGEIAAALEMTGEKGGAQGASALADQERARDIVEAYHVSRWANEQTENPRPIGELAAEVGRRFGIQPKNVQSRYSQWQEIKSAGEGNEELEKYVNRHYRKS